MEQTVAPVEMKKRKDIAFYNYEYTTLDQVKISPLDRGYYFGDGVYEVTKVHNGKCFALSYHLDRLYRSLRLMKIPATIAPDELTELHDVLVEESGIQNGSVYLQVTRGTAPRVHAFPEGITPNILMYVNEDNPHKAELAKNGAKVITIDDIRWQHCDIKSLNLIPNVLGAEKARHKKCAEAFQFRGDELMEGTSSNVFMVRDGILWTRPADELILKGITRQLVITKVAPSCGVTVIERKIDREYLAKAEEVFYTSTTAGIIPVLKIDKETVGDGTIGPVTKALQERYAGLMAEGLP
ncbi:MAG: D-amino-acid transaminase [Negativicoccus succinicivorans]|nr:D-amino-acid transaminase [Negativicoccus succinicivorans]